MRFFPSAVLAIAFSVTFVGCGTNPVTGKTEIQFIGEAREIEIGRTNYQPARQLQGGDYVIDPELTAYVQQVGRRLARVSARPDLPYEFVVLNSSVPNAWAMPGGKIAFNRGLLTEMKSEAELAAVMGHEIVHAAGRHGAQNIERGTLLQGALFALQISQMDSKYGGYVVNSGAVAAQLLSQKFGRDAELISDEYGMRYMKAAGYDPTAAVDLQETFVRLSQGRQTSWLEGLFSSHPPSTDRVERNKATLAELGAGGEYGREVYAQKIAGLMRNKPAYDAYDQGVAALRQGNAARAAELAQNAIRIEPREGKFYRLLGETRLQNEDYDGAIAQFGTAIERNPNNYRPYLTRGLAYRAKGDNVAARRDFERSSALLPNAEALHGLGMIALESGNRRQATQYLEQAATSDSPIGRDANATLARLEPARYLTTRVGTDANGQVVVQISNTAVIPLSDMQLEVLLLDPSGRQVQNRKAIGRRQAIAPGQSQVLATGVGPVASREQLSRVRVVVRSARAQN